MSYTQSSLTALFKEAIQPVVKKNVIAEQPFWSRIQNSSIFKNKNFSTAENKYIIPSEIAYHANAAGRAEGSHIPVSHSGTRVRMSAYLKKVIAITDATYEVKVLQDAGGASVEDVSTSIKNDLTRGFKDSMNIAMIGHPSSYHGDSTYSDMGVRAVVSGSGSGTGGVTLEYHKGSTVVSGAMGNHWLRAGLRLRVGTAAEILAGSAHDNVIVSSVSSDKNSFVPTATFTWADGDLCVPGDSDAYEDNLITGLCKHVDNDTGTYQGLSRSTYPQLQGNVAHNSGTCRAMSEAIWDQAFDLPFEYGAGSNINFVLCNTGMRRAWKNLFTSLMQYDPTKRIVGGSQKIAISDIIPVEDPYMQYGCMYALDTSQFEFVHGDLFAFEDLAGNIFRMVGTYGDTDKYEVRCRVFGNLICKTPRANVKIEDITEA